MSSDQDFGPGLGTAFDFTLTFDHAILNILPSGLLLLAAPFFIRHYKSQAQVILPSPLLWGKLGTAAVLFAIHLAMLVLWCVAPLHRSTLGIASSIVSIVASACLAGCLFTEHRRSMRSSAILSLWLTFGVAFDGAIARSYFLRPDYHDLGAMAVSTAVCKLLILILEEMPKKNFVKDPTTGKPTGKEATSGFWNRTLYLWLNHTFYVGFHRILGVDQLDNLGPEFSSELLSDNFNAVWSKANKQQKHALAITCLHVLRSPALSIILPRLCFTFFIFSQPFFLQAVVSVIGNGASASNKWGLVAAAAMIYFGIAVSKSLYQHLTYRLITLVRGVLIGAIMNKSLTLSYDNTKKNTVVSLMTTEIETIATGLRMLHETWVNVIEVTLGIYLLWRIVGAAAFLVLIPTLLCFWSSWYLGKHFPPAKAAWNEAIEVRVARTSKVLSQIKAIKMSGMEGIVSEQIRELRSQEIRHSSKTRLVGAIYPVVGITCKVFTPSIVIAGGLFLTTFSGSLTTFGAFSTLAFITIISQPLANIMEAGPVVRSSLIGFSRINTFLLLEAKGTEYASQSVTVQDTKCIGEVQSKRLRPENHEMEAINTGSPSMLCIARFTEAAIAVQGNSKTVLKGINLNISEGEFIIITGPTGCGKSTLLRCLLNETNVVSGNVEVKPGAKAFCDQTPWIQNTTIKNNITCYSDLDQIWYDSILDACLLKHDLARLPLGDLTHPGSNGLNLSGGQKHRIAAARAVYARKSVSIFDDILSALDLDTATKIFNNLFGREGLMRRSRNTVILVTNQPQFFDAADRVVLIDSDGSCRLQTVIQDPEFQNEVKELLALNESIAQELDQGLQEPNDDTAESGTLLGYTSDSPVEEIELGRQKGDLTLYWYFIKSMGVFRSTVWLVVTILNAVAEKFPEVFLAIWLQRAPNDPVYFAGYILISLSAIILTVACFGLWFAWAVPSSLESLHNDLLNTVIRAKLSFLTKTDHGVLLNFISKDMTLVSQIMPLIFLRAVYFTFYTLVVMGVVFSGVRYAGIIVPFLLATLYAVQHYYLRTSRQIRHLDLESTAPLYTLVTESMSGLLHIRAFGWEQEVFTEGLNLLDTSQKPHYYMFVIQRWLTVVMDLIVVAIAITMLPIAFNINVSATATRLALSLVSLIQFSEVLSYLITNWTLLETSIGALARLYRLYRNTPLEGNPDHNVDPAWPNQGRLIIKDVTAKYDSRDAGTPILNRVSADIAPTEKIGIVGRTGSGKSSLLLAILNFLDYTGSITIDGVEISTISPELLRWRIPTISQDLLDLEETVRFTVCPRTDTLSTEQYQGFEASTICLLRSLGLWVLMENKDGLDTKVVALGLSQGQQQLLSIARGILRQQITGSKLVLMDEPTSALDLETDRIVQQLLEERLKGCTVVTVAHRPQSIIGADTILELSEGRIYSRSERRKGGNNSKAPLRGKNRPNAGRNRKRSSRKKRDAPSGTKAKKASNSKRRRPVESNLAWNPDEHRYIGHAGPYESSDDGSRVLTTFEKHSLPHDVRQNLYCFERRRDRHIEREGLKGDDGRPMTPITYGQRYIIPKFFRAGPPRQQVPESEAGPSNQAPSTQEPPNQ